MNNIDTKFGTDANFQPNSINIQVRPLNQKVECCLQWSVNQNTDQALQFRKHLEPILIKLDEHPLISIREFSDLEDGSWAVNLDPVDFYLADLLSDNPPYILNALDILNLIYEWLKAYQQLAELSVFFKSIELEDFAVQRIIDDDNLPWLRLRLIALEQLETTETTNNWRINVVDKLLEYLERIPCTASKNLYEWLNQLFSQELSVDEYIKILNQIGIKITVASKTDTGRKRTNNEDSVLTAVIHKQPSTTSPQRALMLVCDGMGGHLAGEIASDFVTTQLGSRLLYLTQQFYYAPDRHKTINEFVSDVNLRLTELASQNPAQMGMGTTVTGAIIIRRLYSIGGRILTFNIGDSRTYAFDAKRYQRLTKDHSYVQQELVDKGILTAEEAFGHPNSNVITRCIGGNTNNFTPDCKDFSLGGGTIVLVCSDGLTDAITEREVAMLIRNILSEPNIDLNQLCTDLVNAANEAGGPDNISIAVAYIDWDLPVL